MDKIIYIKFDEIEIHLPFNSKKIATVKKLLDVLELEISQSSSAEQLEEHTPQEKQPPACAEKSKLSTDDNNSSHHGADNQTVQHKDGISGELRVGEGEKHDDDFIFKECEPFDYKLLPEFRSGKTIYYLMNGRVCIRREGRYELNIFAKVDDLMYLKAHPDKTKEIIKAWEKTVYSNKATVLRGFLNDVGKIGENCVSETDSKDIPSSPSRKTKVQEGMAAGMSAEGISQKYVIPIHVVESIMNVINKVRIA